MQLPALSIRSAMLGTSRLLSVSVRDSLGRCDYAMAYAMGTSFYCYLTLAIHRATDALVGNARNEGTVRLFDLRSK